MVELSEAENGLLRRSFAGDVFNTLWYARRALNEAILEEVPLLTAAGKTLTDMSDEERMGVERSTALRVHAESTAAPRVRAFRCFQWLKTNVKCFSTRHRRVGVVSPSDGTTPEHGLDDLSEHSELDFQCVDLTNATVGIPVVRAMIAEPV